MYKIKRFVDGNIERYKARLIARGFTQQEGIDYSKIFSSIINQAIVSLIFSIVVSCNWKIHQLDINNAFLNGVPTNDVYMKQPSGFVEYALPLICADYISPCMVKTITDGMVYLSE